jgi:hypothetical protein
VSVRITGNGTAKIAEIVEAVLGDATVPFKAVRAALTSGTTTPMDLEAHRKVPALPSGPKLPEFVAKSPHPG